MSFVTQGANSQIPQKGSVLGQAMGGSPPGPVLWTPADMTTYRWYDFSDAATVTLSGSSITQIDDKSGNGGTAVQAFGASQPVIDVASLNGLNTASLNNQAVEAAMTLSAGWSVFFVVKANTVNTTVSVLGGVTDTLLPLGQSGSSNANRWRFASVNDSPIPTIHQNGTVTTWANRTAAHSGLNTNAWQFMSFVNCGAVTDVMTVGRAGGSGFDVLGNIAEIIFVNSTLSSTDRELLEGYVAHKYGLTALLPALHPYKSSAPVV